MSTEPDLHKFDRRLCDYFVGNIRQHFDELIFVGNIRQDCDELTFKAWMAEQVEPLKLRDYLLNCESESSGDEETSLLLNESELYELADGVANMPLGCPLPWTAYEPLHRQYVNCVYELQTKLTKTNAEEWAQTSTQIGELLERPGLKLDEGLEITIDWIREVRRYLKASKQWKWLPCPHGEFFTPTSHGQNTSATTDWKGQQFSEEQIQRVQKAIEALGMDGHDRHHKPDAICIQAGIAKQVGRKILRYLEEQGQYTGFSRARSSRYE